MKISKWLENVWQSCIWLSVYSYVICSCVSAVVTDASPSSPQIDDIKQTLTLKQIEEQDNQKRISNTRRIIEDFKAELDKLVDQPDMSPQIDVVNVDLRRIQVERAKIEGERSDLRRERDNLIAESKCEFYTHCSGSFYQLTQTHCRYDRYASSESIQHFYISLQSHV